MPDDIRIAAVNGVKLAYQVHGEGSGRPPALFVHGYSGRATGDRTYPVLIPALAEVFTVYALDLRAHGASASETQEFSMTACADDVAAVVALLGLDQPFYVGHSFGAFTGLYCETRHPGTFCAMALLASAGASGGAHAGPDAGRFLIEHGKDREALLAAVGPMYLHSKGGEAQVEAVLLMDPEVHKTYFAEYIHLNILDAVRSIQTPVLMVNGALDNVVPLWSQHETALALPRCKEVVFTTEGHMLPRETAAACAREAIAFWEHDAPMMRARVLPA